MEHRIPFGTKPASPSKKYLERSFCPLCCVDYIVETNLWGDVMEDDHAGCKGILRQKKYCEEMLRQSLHRNKYLLIRILIVVSGAVSGAMLALILGG